MNHANAFTTFRGISDGEDTAQLQIDQFPGFLKKLRQYFVRSAKLLRRYHDILENIDEFVGNEDDLAVLIGVKPKAIRRWIQGDRIEVEWSGDDLLISQKTIGNAVMESIDESNWKYWKGNQSAVGLGEEYEQLRKTIKALQQSMKDGMQWKKHCEAYLYRTGKRYYTLAQAAEIYDVPVATIQQCIDDRLVTAVTIQGETTIASCCLLGVVNRLPSDDEDLTL